MNTNTTIAASRSTHNAMTAAVAALSTEQIADAVVTIGGGEISRAENITRNYLLEEFMVRKGEKAYEALLDQMAWI